MATELRTYRRRAAFGEFYSPEDCGDVSQSIAEYKRLRSDNGKAVYCRRLVRQLQAVDALPAGRDAFVRASNDFRCWFDAACRE